MRRKGPAQRDRQYCSVILLVAISCLVLTAHVNAFTPLPTKYSRTRQKEVCSFSINLFRRFRKNDSNNYNTDSFFNYTSVISTDLPPHLASLPDIQEVENCFASPHYVCEHGWMNSTAKDGAKLHYRRCLPINQKPRGIIVWWHGIQGFGGNAHTIQINHDNGAVTTTKTNKALLAERFVAQNGYALYAMDLYGHGYSQGRRHYIPKWQTNLQDAVNFIQIVSSLHNDNNNDDNDNNTPLFCGGESYGGCLTLHVAHALSLARNDTTIPKLDGILLLAPAVLPSKLPPPPVLFVLKQVLARIAPRWQPFFMPNPVSPERIWRDEELRQLNSQRSTRPHVGGSGTPFRLGTAVQLLKALQACRDNAIPNLTTTPFCVVHGTEDHAVPIDGTDYLLEHAPCPDRAELKVEGGYHDLLADPSRDQVVDFLLEWTEGRIIHMAAEEDKEAS